MPWSRGAAVRVHACASHAVRARRGMRRVAMLTFAVLVLLGGAAPVAHAAIPPEWVPRWRADLDTLAAKLPAMHANLFHAMPRDSFEGRIARLKHAVPGMTHAEIAVALAGLVADVRDGHTRLTLPVDPAAGFFGGHSSTPDPKIDALKFHQLPIRLYLYEDGLYVRRVGRAHANAAGAKVLRIGDMSAADAMRVVEPIVQRDNAAQLSNLLPDFLVVSEVLAARGVSRDPGHADYVVRTREGRTLTLDLAAVPLGGAVDWADARDGAPAPAPLYLRDRGKNYWFEPVADDRIVYCQYNEVYDQDDETLDAFADRLFGYVDTHPVEALVLDIRANPGGNNARNRPLLMGLIRCAKLRAPGRLFVIAGRGTFSAAMMFALDVEKYTHAIFVGEETGARPNHYGDSRKLTLPNSGLTVRVSTLYWQYSDPRDDRAAIAPQVPAPLTSADYAANRDPAMDAIRGMVLGPPAAPALDGRREGVLYAGTGAYAYALERAGNELTFASPDLGVEALGVTHLENDATHLAFDVPIESSPMHIEGRWMGGWFVGTATIPKNGSYLTLIPAQ